MYHWALDSEDCLVTLRVTVGHEAPELDSIAVMYPAAEWIERELWELLGIGFRGHPDMRHLLLDDTWPEGDYPMRKNHRGHGPLQHVGAGHACDGVPVGAGHARDKGARDEAPHEEGPSHD